MSTTSDIITSTGPTHRARSTSFGQILKDHASLRAEKPAFVFLNSKGEAERELTYGRLYSSACTLAAELTKRNGAGERAILALPSGLDFVIAMFGCMLAGVIAVPVPNTRGKRTADRVAAIMRDARPRFVLSLKDQTGQIVQTQEDEAFSNTEHILIDDLPDILTAPLPQPPDPHSIALLQYTSGSTGSPKGVMITHRNLVANNQMICAAFGHDQNLRGVGWLPLFHDMGLIGHVLQPVFVGGLSVIMSPLTFLQRPWKWLEAISAWRATTSGGPSMAYDLCLRMRHKMPEQGLDLSSWKVAYCGAETVREHILAEFAESFTSAGFHPQALQPCYGLAEATLLASSCGAEEGLSWLQRETSSSRKIVNCGGSWGDGQIAIVDSQTGRDAADGEIGEIIVSGPHVAAGYWQNQAASAESFADLPGNPGSRRLKTGDLGFIKDGCLYPVGRSKDMIIVMGNKFAAEDVEVSVARSHEIFAGLPCAAFSIEDGKAERAVIVQEIHPRNGGGDLANEAMEAAFSAIVEEHGLRLADVFLTRTGSLPLTSSGKVQRSKAREMYGERGFARLTSDMPRFRAQV